MSVVRALLVLVLLADGAAVGEEAWPTMVIVPLGDPSPALVQHVADSVARRFEVTVEVAEGVPLPRAAWYAPRARWRAEKILDALEALPLEHAWRVTGITEAPISTTKGDVYDWGIAGLARLGGKSCVQSAYYFRRFKKRAPKKYRRYLENLVLHEVGHTFGLPHCPLERCIMADAKGKAVRAARLSSNEFCPRCHERLLKVLRDPTVRGRWRFEERAILGKDWE